MLAKGRWDLTRRSRVKEFCIPTVLSSFPKLTKNGLRTSPEVCKIIHTTGTRAQRKFQAGIPTLT
jgi:hypothetical protein